MTGTIELSLGRTPRHKTTIPFYSKLQCRSIYNFWMDKYQDAVITIWVRPTDEKEYIGDIKETVEEKSRAINMPDYVGKGIFRKESFYHKLYYKNETLPTE